MTLEELRKIEEELHELKANKRVENAKRIKAAREKGDLSNNPEYDAAKEEQRVIENRIDEIGRILKEELLTLPISCKTSITSMTRKEAERLMDWVVNQGMTSEKAKEAVAYTIGVEVEQLLL